MFGRGNLESSGGRCTQDNLRRQAQLVKSRLQLVKPGNEQSDGCQWAPATPKTSMDESYQARERTDGKMGTGLAWSFCYKWLVAHRVARQMSPWPFVAACMARSGSPRYFPMFFPIFSRLVVRQARSSLVRIALGRNESFEIWSMVELVDAYLRLHDVIFIVPAHQEVNFQNVIFPFQFSNSVGPGNHIIHLAQNPTISNDIHAVQSA